MSKHREAMIHSVRFWYQAGRKGKWVILGKFVYERDAREFAAAYASRPEELAGRTVFALFRHNTIAAKWREGKLAWQRDITRPAVLPGITQG